MSGPNLSEYFRNDAPSMFDEIVPSAATATAVDNSTIAMGNFLNTKKIYI